MFRKSKILLVLPLTIEFQIDSSGEGYSLAWADQKSRKWEVQAHEDLIKHLLVLSRDYARYQKEPFSLASSHHRWVWFYEQYVPQHLHTAYSMAVLPSSLLFDHYGKTVMEAYVSEQLKAKEQEFTSVEQVSMCVLTWNAAGNSPRGNLSEWLRCQSKKYENSVLAPDLLVIGIQEMCELTKLLGDQTREIEWAEYLRLEAFKTFGIEYAIVRGI